MFPLKLIAGIKGAGLIILLGCIATICMEDDTDYVTTGDVYDGPEEQPSLKTKIRERYAPAAVCVILAGIEAAVDIGFIFFTP